MKYMHHTAYTYTIRTYSNEPLLRLHLFVLLCLIFSCLSCQLLRECIFECTYFFFFSHMTNNHTDVLAHSYWTVGRAVCACKCVHLNSFLYLLYGNFWPMNRNCVYKPCMWSMHVLIVCSIMRYLCRLNSECSILFNNRTEYLFIWRNY